MKKVLVLGKDGQLGWELCKCFHKFDGDIQFLSRKELDLNNREQIKNVINSILPDIVVNAAAYTQVDLAEKEKHVALKVNGEAVNSIAELARELNFWLIHISTDFVFSGTSNEPYLENDAVGPINAYGKSKALGDQYILDHSDINYTIIRTSWVYSKHGNNFVKTMLRLAQERDKLGIVFDQVGTPTHAKDLAEVIYKFVSNGFNEGYKGIFNFSNEGIASWYDFAIAIKKIKKLKIKFYPIRSEDFPTPAKRPSYSVLDKSKIKKTLNIKIKHWFNALEEMLNEL